MGNFTQYFLASLSPEAKVESMAYTRGQIIDIFVQIQFFVNIAKYVKLYGELNPLEIYSLGLVNSKSY